MAFSQGQGFQPGGRQQVGMNVLQQQPQQSGFSSFLGGLSQLAGLAAPFVGLANPVAGAALGGAAGVGNAATSGQQQGTQSQATRNQVSQGGGSELAATNKEINPTESPTDAAVGATDTLTDPTAVQPNPMAQDPQQQQEYLQQLFMSNPYAFMMLLASGMGGAPGFQQGLQGQGVPVGPQQPPTAQ